MRKMFRSYHALYAHTQRDSTGQGVALRRSDPERQSESGRRSRWRGTVSASGLSRLTAWSTGSLSTAKAQRRVLVVVIVVLREAWKQQRKRRRARRVEREQRRALRARLDSACERRTARPPLAVSRAWTWATLCLRRRRRCGWHHVRRTYDLDFDIYDTWRAGCERAGCRPRRYRVHPCLVHQDRSARGTT